MSRRCGRRGFTLVEIAIVLTVSASLLLASAFTARSALVRNDRGQADLAIDRVVQAQVGHAAVHGLYAYSASGDDSELAGKLPESLSRDLTLTHGMSTSPNVVSLAVGTEQTLVVAIQLADRSCRWRVTPSFASGGPSPQDVRTRDKTVVCDASQLLPGTEVAATR